MGGAQGLGQPARRDDRADGCKRSRGRATGRTSAPSAAGQEKRHLADADWRGGGRSSASRRRRYGRVAADRGKASGLRGAGQKGARSSGNGPRAGAAQQGKGRAGQASGRSSKAGRGEKETAGCKGGGREEETTSREGRRGQKEGAPGQPSGNALGGDH